MAADNVKLELIIYNFSREHYEKQSDIHIPIALKHLFIQFSKMFFSSTILSFKQDLDFVKLLITKLKDERLYKKLKLLYRASDNEFSARSFHNACAGHGNTITIIKSNFGNIFGGYADIKWSHGEKSDKIFLFLFHKNAL